MDEDWNKGDFILYIALCLIIRVLLGLILGI